MKVWLLIDNLIDNIWIDFVLIRNWELLTPTFYFIVQLIIVVFCELNEVTIGLIEIQLIDINPKAFVGEFVYFVTSNRHETASIASHPSIYARYFRHLSVNWATIAKIHWIQSVIYDNIKNMLHYIMNKITVNI